MTKKVNYLMHNCHESNFTMQKKKTFNFWSET